MKGNGRFPALQHEPDMDGNLAVQLFGRRFYKDQTLVEYLAEFLLVVDSRKGTEGLAASSDPFPADFTGDKALEYFPQRRIPLKFFSFFATSKLETRHSAHRQEFERRLDDLKGCIETTDGSDHDEFIRALQSLFGGFVGIAKNRTWVTQAFFPATRSLIAREVMWDHTEAIKKKARDWEEAYRFFSVNRHNFMARGGEALYLQLLNLFTQGGTGGQAPLPCETYSHLTETPDELREALSAGLTNILGSLEKDLGQLASFIEETFGHDLEETGSSDSRATCGWVPSATLPEAHLFAWEMKNILGAELDPLQKTELLQVLCALHVLRSLCFQAARTYARPTEAADFAGHYAWIVAPPVKGEGTIRHLAERNYECIEQLIQLALRSPSYMQLNVTPDAEAFSKADDNGHLLLRKLGKTLGVVVPPTGRGMRFSLPRNVIRFFVPALIPPGQRMRMDEFLDRLYLHYGIALGGARLADASHWTAPEAPPKVTWEEPDWFSDALRAGGFLIPLSDAISMVRNPFGSQHRSENSQHG